MTKEEFLAKEQAGAAVLIDIREPMELAALPALTVARNVPMSQLVAVEAQGGLPKDKLIVTICHSGGRCGAVNGYLASRGYQVDQIDGGMLGWWGRLLGSNNLWYS